MCKLDRKKLNEQYKRRIEKKMKLGLCIVCNKPKDDDGLQKCPKCREKYRRNHNLLVSDRAYFGVCIKCGKEDEHTLAVLEKGLETGKIKGARCKECNRKNWERIQQRQKEKEIEKNNKK